MTAPICEYEGILQEWAPESRLLLQIPAKAQRGIFSYDLKLTCVDVLPEFITLGTNCGLVYWYNRQSAELQRLRFEDTNCSVTCVKIVSTVDYMVAAGTDIGNLTVFQIPKATPEELPEELKPKKKQVERFTINGLHKSPVTCLEWSQNGMKLFSGDRSGAVVLTTIDFQMHVSKSTELLNEKFEVVQLSYFQQTLLVSTIFRAILCHGSRNWQVTQIGTKDRKILGKFGAIFCKFDHGVVIYASRPGQRLWLASLSGNVEKTLIFKSALESTHPTIPLINPFARRDTPDIHFGKLIQFGENCLVSYHTGMLHVLHPGAITVVASLFDARNVLDVAVNKNEVFILEGDRSLLRIGFAPDPLSMAESTTHNNRRSFIFDELATKIKDTAVGSLKRITSDFLSTGEKISPPTIADEALDLPPIVSLPNGVAGGLFPVGDVEIHESIDDKYLSASVGAIPKVLPLISNNQKYFEEEGISRPGRRRKVKNVNKNFNRGGGNESESDTLSTASEDRIVCGFAANEPSVSEESPSSWSISQSSFSILRDINSLLPQPNTNSKLESLKTPDDRSQASIDTCESVSENMALTPDLFKEAQEKTFFRLANQEGEMLDSFNSERTENMSISVNLTPSSSASSKLSDHILSSEQSENVSMVSECEMPNETSQAAATLTDSDAQQPSISSEDSQDQRQWNKEFILSQILGLDLDDPLNKNEKKRKGQVEGSGDSEKFEECATPLVETADLLDYNSLLPESEQYVVDTLLASAKETLKPDDEHHKFESFENLSYGPPSGSSMISSCHPSLDLNSGPTNLSNPQALVVEKIDRWLQYKAPNNLVFLSICNNYVVSIATSDQVFYSKLSEISLKWQSLDYKASIVAMSSDAKLVWSLGQRCITALIKPSETGPFSDESVEVTTNACFLACDNDTGYFALKDGTIKCQKKLDRFPCGRTEDLPCPWKIKSIIVRYGIVLAITFDGNLVCKSPDSESFTLIETPSKIIYSIALGPQITAWIVDGSNNIYFSDDFCSTTSHWWHVIISEYIFQNPVSPFLTMHNKIKMGNLRANIQNKQTMIAANDNSVWIYNKYSSSVQVNKTGFTGCIWHEIPVGSMMKIIMICAHGSFEDKGNIWLLSDQNDLFTLAPSIPERIQSVSNPCIQDIVCIASAPDTLWALTVDGTLYARLGISEDNLIGIMWRELCLPQFTDKKITWVSCGCDVAWCVDATGTIYISIVPPYNMATNVTDAAWTEVGGKPKNTAHFIKVFVGPYMHMVWALDNRKQIYVREGIFPKYEIGTGWVHVGGIEAIHLSVSSTAVWAVGQGNAVYRRHGISENNYIGDYWRRVANGSISSMSVSFDDKVWCINKGAKLSRLLQKRVSLETNEVKRNVSESEDKDWLVVE